MKKAIIVISLIIIAVASAVAYQIITTEEKQEIERIIITASFYPLYEFARQVGGEKVEVINITPAGTKPHGFEPTPKDLIAIQNSKLFIFNGAGLDPWAEKIAPELEEKGVVVIHMAKHFELIEGEEKYKHDDYNDKYKDEYKKEVDGKRLDPHIWLDPIIAKRQVEIIRDALIKIDPINSSLYEENARQYLEKLSELDQKFQQGLAVCQIREAVASHAAFGYLAKRYNLTIFSIAGLSPKEEPSLRRLGEIAKLAQEKNIRYIFFETLVSPKLAETIAKEIGAQTLVFNPIEGLTEEEIKQGKNYISIMEENLKNLRRALVCK